MDLLSRKGKFSIRKLVKILSLTYGNLTSETIGLLETFTQIKTPLHPLATYFSP